MRTELTRWVLIRLPNEAFAQQAQTSVDDMTEFLFNATLLDWSVEVKRYKEIAKVFQAAEEGQDRRQGNRYFLLDQRPQLCCG